MRVIKTEKVCLTEKEQSLGNEFYNMIDDILGISQDELLNKACRNLLLAIEKFDYFIDKEKREED